MSQCWDVARLESHDVGLMKTGMSLGLNVATLRRHDVGAGFSILPLQVSIQPPNAALFTYSAQEAEYQI